MRHPRRNRGAAADIMGAWVLQVILVTEEDSLVEVEETEEGEEEGVVGVMAAAAAEGVVEVEVVGAEG